MNQGMDSQLKKVDLKPCLWCRRPTANGDECLMCESSIRWLDEQTPLKAADIHKLMSTSSTFLEQYVDKNEKREHVGQDAENT